MRERLYRSRDDRMIFGVAGGMAEWLDIDPAIVRIVWALLVLAAGAGFLLYIVAAIVIPEEPSELAAPAGSPAVDPAAAGGVTRREARQTRRTERQAVRAGRPGTGGIVLGLVLVVVGIWLLARNYLPFIDDRLVGPAFLIIIGLVLVVTAMNRPRHTPPS